MPDQKRDLIKDVINMGHSGHTITVCGTARYVKNRDNKVVLLLMDDSSDLPLRTVVPKDHPEFDFASKLLPGRNLMVTGELEVSPSDNHRHEVIVSIIKPVTADMIALDDRISYHYGPDSWRYRKTT